MPRIAVTTTDKDVIEKVSNILNRKYQAIETEKSIKNGWKQLYFLNIRGKPSVDIMKQLYPHMGNRRKQQITKSLSSYHGKYYVLDNDDIRKIRKLCSEKKKTQQEIADLFNLNRGTVNKIHRRKLHADVE